MEVRQLLIMVLIIVGITLIIPIIEWVALTYVQHSTQSLGSLINEVSNHVQQVLRGCGVPGNAFIVTQSTTYSNGSVLMDIGLSNNDELVIALNLSPSQIPIGSVNITLKTPSGKTCPAHPVQLNIPSAGNYNYYVEETNYAIIIVSYKGTQPPFVTNTTGSVTIYGVTPATIVAIPRDPFETITCNTGSLTPTYMVTLLGHPIIYVKPGNPHSSSVLCTYYQGGSLYFLVMALIMGISIAVAYEALILLIGTIRSLKPK
ncbi:hypothetical protein [Vulcanisaeta thermophila]|uniref:hypothetical protein n=1 Tax=Vulcanisaeta thermophila TaxID=867917 RepID=UPI000852F599|nr:hypothetical protein [Vulcanisaeta thermophila]